MNRLNWVTGYPDPEEEWDRKKSKYCCEMCEKSVNNHSDLSSHFGSDTLLCSTCRELDD